ncbi:MAG: protein kinase [Sandaracinus sp.]
MSGPAASGVDAPAGADRIGPYERIDLIGAGSSGRVHRARDTRTGELVAIKSLRPDATIEDLYGIKREFRLVADLHSPHLVPIYDLFVDDTGAHVVMPLLHGQTLDRWASATRWREQPARLYEVLDGIAAGLEDLHRAGLVHRDVKPHNVMVEPDGRVLLVDYGLATHRLLPERFVTSSPSHFAGTLAFMSPEAIGGVEASPTRDVFALAATACAVITGRVPPRRAGAWEVALDQVRERLALAWPEAPESLPPLLERALAPTPTARCTLAELREALQRLARASEGSSIRADADPSAEGAAGTRDAEAIVGREDEARTLAGWCARTRGLVAVSGPSGIGKTSLVQQALVQARTRGEVTLVLASRCHPGEHVRYRTIDGVVDELTRWLVRCGTATRQEILGADAATLEQAFPVLGRMAPTERPESHVPHDPDEHRARLGPALAGLLARVAAAFKTVVWIDDIQWADADGTALLVEALTRLGERAPLVLVTGQSIPEPFARRCQATLPLDPLPSERARALIASRLAAPVAAPELVDALVRRANGNPGLLRHLVDHAAGAGGSLDALSLASVLRRRLEGHSPAVRATAQALALAGEPLPRDALLAVAGEDGRRVLAELGSLGLARAVPTRTPSPETASRSPRSSSEAASADVAVEIAHDALREAIAAGIAAGEHPALHRRIAEALERRTDVPNELVASHWERAGEPQRACAHLRRAAESADAALAFDHAARSWRKLTELEVDAAVRAQAHAALARTLGHLGRGKEAAEHYDRAAALGAGEAPALGQAAAIELVQAGYVDEGLARVRTLFAALGVRVPASGLGLVVRLAGRWMLARLRGVSYRLTEHVSRRDEEIADAAFALTTVLASNDTALAMYTQSLHLAHALRSGSPLRIARALALESGLTSMSGRSPAHAQALLDEARLVMGARSDPRLLALFAVSRASAAWIRGEFRQCVELAGEAERIARDECVGAWWELGLARSVLQDSLRWQGRYGELRERTEGYLADAARRADRYGLVTYRTRFASTLALVDGDVDAAWEACTGEGAWGAEGTHLQHLAALHARAEILLYAGRPEEALEEVDRASAGLRMGALWVMPSPRAKLLHLRACCALACAQKASGSPRRALLRRASADLARVRRAGWRYATLLAEIGEESIRAVQGARDEVALRRLEERATALDLGALAAALGTARSPEGAARLRALGPHEPERFAWMLAPGLVAAPPPRPFAARVHSSGQPAPALSTPVDAPA